mgnify:CR=1 FL=1
MRASFFTELHKLMSENKDIVFITADLGYGLADKIKQDYPEQFFNVQAAEQAMIGVAIGMALSGKIPICYSITPFLLYRPYEAIALYLEGEQIPVIMVGSGRGQDYHHDGVSHWEGQFPFEMEYVKPETYPDMATCLQYALNENKPLFISLKR